MLRNPTPKSFSAEVARRLAAGGTSYAAVARAMGISRQTLYQWEKEPADLRLSQLASLVAATGEPMVIRLDPNPEDAKEQAPRPLWAEELADEIKSDLKAEIQATQDVVVGAVAHRTADATAQALGPHLQQLLDVLARLDARLGE